MPKIKKIHKKSNKTKAETNSAETNLKSKAKKTKSPVKEALHELDMLDIIAEEKKVEQNVENVEKKEEGIDKKEAEIISQEKVIQSEVEKVEKIENDVKSELNQKPLTKLSIKDLNKGIIGAFIGVVAHFAFISGKEIAKDITVLRATLLFIFSYILIIILMYETGYRKIRETRLLNVLPRRATAIYFTSLAVVLLIFILFNQIDVSSPLGLYKQIAVTSVLAALGAGTADLIGRG